MRTMDFYIQQTYTVSDASILFCLVHVMYLECFVNVSCELNHVYEKPIDSFIWLEILIYMLNKLNCHGYIMSSKFFLDNSDIFPTL